MAKKPKRISPKLLAGDETVMMESRTSRIKHMTGGTFAIIVAIFFLLLSFWNRLGLHNFPGLQTFLDGSYGGIISLASLGIAGLLFIYYVFKWLKWISTAYIMTDERVITKRGILGRSIEDMPLQMVTNVDVNQSVLQRMFGYGNVVFSSQSGDRDDVVWKSVPNPMKVRRLAQEAMDKRYRE
jgi:uncharacterized membrane protein YdbT with pleckstrin-like domain